MNCPFHVLTYKQGQYSYRDLPLRWAELGTVYRYERSGTMHGLFRVRGFTQVRRLPACLCRTPYCSCFTYQGGCTQACACCAHCHALEQPSQTQW